MATALELPPLQGMTTSALRITIPFHPLLRRITKFLKFPEPKCQLLEGAQNNMCIAVKTDIGPVAYVYVGGETETLGESFERASQIAVRDLVKKYSILMEDVTYNETLAQKKCADLYRLKRAKLERKKKHKCRKGKGRALSRFGGIMGSVSVDYLLVVRAIFKKIEIRSTPIKTVQIWPDQFVAWLTITPVDKLIAEECLISEPCLDTETVEQNLAKKIISYVSSLYNIEIIDVNHDSQESSFPPIITISKTLHLTPRKIMASSLICDLLITDNLDMMSDTYASKKIDETREALAHVLNNAQPHSPDLTSGENRVPEGIFHEEIMSKIFDCSNLETKKNMAEACKQWASWFLLGGPRSYLEYETTLVKEESEFSVTLRDENIIVQENFKCREASTMEERLRIHRQRWPEHESDAESVGENKKLICKFVATLSFPFLR